MHVPEGRGNGKHRGDRVQALIDLAFSSDHPTGDRFKRSLKTSSGVEYNLSLEAPVLSTPSWRVMARSWGQLKKKHRLNASSDANPSAIPDFFGRKKTVQVFPRCFATFCFSSRNGFDPEAGHLSRRLHFQDALHGRHPLQILLADGDVLLIHFLFRAISCLERSTTKIPASDKSNMWEEKSGSPCFLK